MSGSALRSSYADAFDSGTSIADFDRQTLSHLGREYLLIGHLLDRVSMPLLVELHGGPAQTAVAIDEWMAALAATDMGPRRGWSVRSISRRR